MFSLEALTDKETQVLLELRDPNGDLSSHRLRQIFNTEKGRKTLTKENFPNIRKKLCSFMTAYRRAAYRGGFAWISVIEWKDGLNSLHEFIDERISRCNSEVESHEEK